MELRGSLLAPRPPAEPPAPPQPRSISFLIRDILADRRSGSDPGQPEPRAEPFRTGPDEDREPASTSDPAGGAAGVRTKKPRKSRTAFSEQQLNHLETSFQNHKYLSVQARMDLAASLQLSDTQVKTWYQNRRTKWKRQSAAGLEFLAAAGRMFLPHHFLCHQAPPTPDHFLCGGHAHHLTAPPLLTHILTRSDLC